MSRNVGEGGLLNRYLPTVAAVLGGVNLGIMHWGTQHVEMLYYWLVGLHVVVIVLAVAVQLEAIKRHPENYPRICLN